MATNSGSCIFCSCCAACGHGLDCHSCCLATACAMYSLYLCVHLPFCCFVWLFCFFFVFCFWVHLCETVFFYHLDLLRLPNLSLPNISCFSLPLWDLLLLTPCSISCLSEDDTAVQLLVYLLLCVNELDFTVSAQPIYTNLVHSSRLSTWC